MIGLLLVGAVAGVAAGMFGIGGGVVIVPALTALFAFELTAATGTSLAALLMPVSLFAVLSYYRAGKLSIRVAAPIAVGLAVSSYFGAQFALSLPKQTLQQAYGVFLLYAAWRFAEPRKWYRSWRDQTPMPNPTGEGVKGSDYNTWLLLGIGLLAGVLSGMFGIGGGLIIVPALVGLLKFDQKEAVGTSLAALLLPVGLPGVIAYYQQGKLDIPTAALVAGGLAVGAFIGARIALNLPSQTVKRLYALFLVAMALRFIFGA